MTLYTEENEFVYESDNIIDDRYIINDKDFVYYCNITENDCKKYNYTYNKKNKTIFINAEDKFIKKGTYKVSDKRYYSYFKKLLIKNIFGDSKR